MILDLIKNRRSIFPAEYNAIQIESKEIEQILEAANWAPTHRKTEPWRFKVLQSDAKANLGAFLAQKYNDTESNPKEFKFKKIKEKCIQSNAIIAICMQRDPNESVPEWEEIAATAMAVQNMWLMCTHLQIGCYWSSPKLIKYMPEFFNLNDGEQCLGFLYMGYYTGKSKEGNRTPISDKVEWLK